MVYAVGSNEKTTRLSGINVNLVKLGVPPFLREAFKGAIIIAAVLLQRKSSDN